MRSGSSRKKMYTSTLAALLGVALLSCEATAVKEEYFTLYASDTAITSSVISTYAASHVRCTVQCMADGSCEGFNLQQTDTATTCQLLSNIALDATSCEPTAATDATDSAAYLGEKVNQDIYLCQHASDYSMHFPTKSTTDYAVIPNAFPLGFNQISVCLWLRVPADSFVDCLTKYGSDCPYHSVWTYHRDGNSNEEMEYTVYPDGCMRFYMWGSESIRAKVCDYLITDGNWHFVCTTYNSLTGAHQIFLDDQPKYTGTSSRLVSYIADTGANFIIGQDVDYTQTDFNETQAFVGDLADLNVYHRILTDAEVATIRTSCLSNGGSAIKWLDFKTTIAGGVSLDMPSNCTP
ncbi:PREDICTED: neuronal pentraxin-2-like isoform X2 [Priapulus caudatus]|nr:PREDICTED: neuronal pentraxin-2-like isoform X2 [Priapulus caudatus]